MSSESRNLMPGDVIVHVSTASRHTIRERKADDSGWWLVDGGGIADLAFHPDVWQVEQSSPLRLDPDERGVLPDDPDADLVDRIWLALGVPPPLLSQIGYTDTDAVQMAATIGRRAHRLQFVVEDWGAERGWREDAEQAIRDAATRHPDDTELANYVTWMDER